MTETTIDKIDTAGAPAAPEPRNSILFGERPPVTGDEAEKPHPLLEEKYRAGEFGRKTGKGSYSYER